MNAITLPSGENAGRRSSGPAVIWCAVVAPFDMSTIQIVAVRPGRRRAGRRSATRSAASVGSSSVSELFAITPETFPVPPFITQDVLPVAEDDVGIAGADEQLDGLALLDLRDVRRVRADDRARLRERRTAS